MQATKPPSRPQRAVSLIDRAGSWSLIHICHRGQLTYYLVQETPADWGSAFVLEKQDLASETPLATYHVNTGDREHWPLCDCPAFDFHGHCKHVVRSAPCNGPTSCPATLRCRPDDLPSGPCRCRSSTPR